jgi:tripeptidyl-peptidase-1
MLRTALLSFALAAVASASKEVEARVQFEADRPTSLPEGWVVKGASHRDTTLELVFAVKQQNLKKLEEEVLAVSDPASPRYGQHLTNRQVHALVAPTAAHVEAVHAFLARHGVSGSAQNTNSDFITAHVSVGKAEAMLAYAGEQYQEVHHAETGQIIHRLPRYALPAGVAGAVDLVAPTVFVPTTAAASPRAAAAPPAATGPNGLFNTPKSLRALYQLPDSAYGNSTNVKQAVTGPSCGGGGGVWIGGGVKKPLHFICSLGQHVHLF